MTAPRSDPDAGPFVLDASAVLGGRPVPAHADVWVPSRVLEEVTGRGRDRRSLDYALEARLRVSDPSPDALDRVRDAAQRTGDWARLSAADVDILALALDVAGTILTDDYSIQNVATVLEVPYHASVQRGIRDVWTWTRRCTGCRREVTEPGDECPVCGSPVRSSRKR